MGRLSRRVFVCRGGKVRASQKDEDQAYRNSLIKNTQANSVRDLGEDGFIWYRGDIYIHVHDEVTNGCLPNPSRLKNKMEVALRKHGFGIETKKGPGITVLSIRPFGYGNGVVCSTYIAYKLSFLVEATVPWSVRNNFNEPEVKDNTTDVLYSVDLHSWLTVGLKKDSQFEFEKTVQAAADQLLLRKKRAEERVKRDYPFIEKNMNAWMDTMLKAISESEKSKNRKIVHWTG